MSSNRPDFAAPHWLVQLLRSKPEPVPWTRAFRAPIALAVPLAVGYALGFLIGLPAGGNWSYRSRPWSGSPRSPR